MSPIHAIDSPDIYHPRDPERVAEGLGRKLHRVLARQDRQIKHDMYSVNLWGQSILDEVRASIANSLEQGECCAQHEQADLIDLKQSLLRYRADIRRTDRQNHYFIRADLVLPGAHFIHLDYASLPVASTASESSSFTDINPMIGEPFIPWLVAKMTKTTSSLIEDLRTVDSSDQRLRAVLTTIGKIDYQDK